MKKNLLATGSTKRFVLHALTVTAAAGSLLLTSCNKDKDDPKPKTKTELLTAKSWRVTADVTTTTGITGIPTSVNNYVTYAACEKDDFYKFEANKVFKVDEGATKCDPTDPQTEIGAWDLNSDQSKIMLSSPELGGISLPFEIVELTETTLKVKASIPATPDNTVTQSYTYTAF